MKKHFYLFAGLVISLAPFVLAVTKQAKQEGASAIVVPNGADVDALTVTQNDAGQLAINVTAGGVALYQRTIAQLDALTPVTTGQLMLCSNCTRSTICVSSGTTTGAWVIAVATGTFVGTTWSGLQHCQ